MPPSKAPRQALITVQTAYCPAMAGVRALGSSTGENGKVFRAAGSMKA